MPTVQCRLDEFAAELERVGISVDTPRAFIANQLLWRDVIRARFGAQANVDEAQVERSANAEKSGSSIEVLLTEIIMAMQPGQEQEVRERARELSKFDQLTPFPMRHVNFLTPQPANLGDV